MLKKIRNSFVVSASILVAASFSSLNIAVAADAANGEQLSQTCLGCHGAPGLRNPGPVYYIPMIGGQNEAYIISSLQAYKAKTRGHKTMQAQASNLTDENMADIAAYFSAMKGNSRPSLVNKAKAEMGKKASVTCVACHGETGNGVPGQDQNPKLGGQYENFLVHALKSYRSGDRQNAIMSGFAGNLTIGQIEALAAYFASQESDLSAPKTKIFK
jgi:cytochrome c553